MRNRKQKGFSLIELLIVVAIILVIAAMAVTKFLRARISANEASAVSSMRTITNAEIAYGIIYGVGYTNDLTKLGPAAVPSVDGADMIDDLLAHGKKQGYLFSVSAATRDNFQIDATPETPGRTGIRNFCSDQSSVLHAGDDGAPCDLNANALQ